MRLGNVLILFLYSFILNSQTEEKPSFWEEKFTMNGYVKYLYTGSSFSNNWVHGELIHNRFNTRFYFTDNITGGLEMRNRIFFGINTMDNNLFFGLKNMDGIVNSAWAYQEELGDPVVSSQLDRWWLNYQKGTWEFRLGKQRINWGMNYLWNMNDVFNAYNFADFDYEERPGVEAIRVTKYIGDLNQLQLAYSPTKDPEQFIAGFMYRFNYKSYDYQVIGGLRFQEPFFGFGWAGSIKNVGFKGEFTSFYEDKNVDPLMFTGSFSLDYTWSNGIMASMGYYYNSEYDAGTFTINGLGFVASPKSLLPVPHAMYAQVGHSFSPLFRGDMIVMGLPTYTTFFLMPNVSYSVSNSVDLSIVDQMMVSEEGMLFQSLNVRLKWSF